MASILFNQFSTTPAVQHEVFPNYLNVLMWFAPYCWLLHYWLRCNKMLSARAHTPQTHICMHINISLSRVPSRLWIASVSNDTARCDKRERAGRHIPRERRDAGMEGGWQDGWRDKNADRHRAWRPQWSVQNRPNCHPNRSGSGRVAGQISSSLLGDRAERDAKQTGR